jgi:hypothetical protein
MTIPAITPLPTAPARTDPPATFVTRADAWVAALGGFTTEANAAGVAISAVEIAGTLSEVQDTSVSSLAIGLGAKSFEITAGKSFVIGMTVTAADSASPSTNYMVGNVTSYSGTTLVLNVTSIAGSGTISDWSVFQSPTSIAASEASITRSARTANTILGAADSGTLIEYTANTFTQTITAAATLGAGWFVYLKNSGTGLITLDPDGAETIDGDATRIIGINGWLVLQCDGSNFNIVAQSDYKRTLLSINTLSATSILELDTVAGYEDFEIEFIAVRPSGSSSQFRMSTSSDGGSTYASSYDDYKYYVNAAGALQVLRSAAAGYLTLTQAQGGAANETGIFGSLILHRPADAEYTKITGQVYWDDDAGHPSTTTYYGVTPLAALVNTIKLNYQSGTMTGTINFYGTRND